MNFKYVIFAIITIFFFSCSSENITEIEPNNNPHTPQVIPTKCSVSGFFNNDYDNDYYNIVAEKKSIIGIILETESNQDGHIKIYNKSHTLRKEINYYNEGISEVINNIKIENEIMICVSGRSKTTTKSPYKLSIFTIDGSENESEPNNNIKDANKISANSTITGYYPPNISNKTENDFYVLQIKENGIWSVNISIEPGEGFNPSIEIYDYQGNLSKAINNHSFGEAEIFKNITIEGPGEIFIKIFGTINNNSHAIYQLINETISAQQQTENEPNENIKNATYFNNNSDEIEGYINQTNDVDCYYISPDFPDGKLLNLTLYPPEGVAITMSLYDSIKKEISTCAIPGASGLYTIKNIEVFKNQYFIIITPTSSNYNEEDLYILKKFYRDILPGLEKEPNNSIKTATHIDPSKMYSGYLPNINDLDYFQFNIYTDNIYNFEINPIKDSIIHCEIYNQRNKQIYDFDINGTNEYQKKEINLKKGTYKALFRLTVTSSINPDEPYRFKINPK